MNWNGLGCKYETGLLNLGRESVAEPIWKWYRNEAADTSTRSDRHQLHVPRISNTPKLISVHRFVAVINLFTLEYYCHDPFEQQQIRLGQHLMLIKWVHGFENKVIPCEFDFFHKGFPLVPILENDQVPILDLLP